jgi:hypothetical protein
MTNILRSTFVLLAIVSGTLLLPTTGAFAESPIVTSPSVDDPDSNGDCTKETGALRCRWDGPCVEDGGKCMSCLGGQSYQSGLGCYTCSAGTSLRKNDDGALECK